MTCTRIGNAIVCTSPWGRLHVGNRYIWVEFHSYCGPTFFTDRNCTEIYEPDAENDPVWPEFDKWHAKYRAAHERRARTPS